MNNPVFSFSRMLCTTLVGLGGQNKKAGQRGVMLYRRCSGEDMSNISYLEHKSAQETLRAELSLIHSEYKTKMNLPSQIAQQFPTEHGNVDDSLTSNFTEVVMSASLDCMARMMKFAGQIMSLSVEHMGAEPPCSFLVVSIGSMARGEATPYSDREYMFLITE